MISRFRTGAYACALAVATLGMTTPVTTAVAGGEIVLHAGHAPTIVGAWNRVTDSTAADGVRLENPDAGQPKRTTAMAAPTSYFELTFTPVAGVPYRLWIRSRAHNDAWTNDSVFVQFSGSRAADGSAIYRIGTTAAAIYSLEECSGAGEAGWGWQDTGYGVNVDGAPIYFDGSPQTIRIQTREDGISIDQIVLSPALYLSARPGAAKYDATILPEDAGTAPAATSTSIVWTSLVRATADGETVRKSSGCSSCFDAGAVSQQHIDSRGSVSFTPAVGQRLYAGLGSDTSSSTSYAIDYAFSFWPSGAWEVREKNVYRTEGRWAAGDIFTVALDNGVVTYSVNAKTVYISRVAPLSPLVVDTSMASVGSSVDVVALNTGATTGDETSTAPPPPPQAVPSSPSSTASLRVLQWNTHHGGYGTDGVYSPDRLASWAALMNPDIVMFNEIERFTGWGNQDQPEVYKALLQQKTGKTWYYVFAQEYGQWNANGKGNLILSSVPIEFANRYELVSNGDRSVAEAAITWKGRRITLLLTHLDPDSQTLRLTQAQEVTGWAAVEPENRILTGDINAWPDQTSIAHLDTLYNDSWAVAAAAGTATAFSGNDGQTKNGRIDYIFYSKGAPDLSVAASQVFDTRDAAGVMPSDHRPVLTTFTVR